MRKEIAKEKNQNYVINESDYKIDFLESSDKLEKSDEMPDIVYYISGGQSLEERKQQKKAEYNVPFKKPPTLIQDNEYELEDD